MLAVVFCIPLGIEEASCHAVKLLCRKAHGRKVGGGVKKQRKASS
jgi:hypothetical protein